MEKNLTEIFMGWSLPRTVYLTLKAGQAAASEIPIFWETKNGAIVMMMNPLCREADIWLGALGEYDITPANVIEHSWCDTVAPGGSHTIQWCDPDDGHIEPVNCLACANAKIAYLSRLVKLGGISRDEDKDAHLYLEANGFSRHRGAVCTTVKFTEHTRSGLQLRPILRTYIAFSGATEDEDLTCTLATSRRFIEEVRCQDERFSFVSHSVDGRIDHL